MAVLTLLELIIIQAYIPKDCTKSPCPLGGDHAIQGFTYTTGERDGVPIGKRV